MINRHSRNIPADIIRQIDTKLNEIRELMKPYAITLTPTERREMPKMGEKSFAFVEKSHDYALNYPNLVPSYLDMLEFDIDFADARGLWSIRNSAKQVYDIIDDTAMAAGSESFQAALLFYSTVKTAAAKNSLGAKTIFEELKQRFPSHRRKSGDTK
jgi:hypothetical protein